MHETEEVAIAGGVAGTGADKVLATLATRLLNQARCLMTKTKITSKPLPKMAQEKLLSSKKIPAKKWGDTEIAERGRSVLVMRARYRSAGLTPHQRGWTDAG